MYQFEMAGDDFKRLQKILTWTGHPGVKYPTYLHFISNEEGIYLWTDNDYCELLFKLHGPIGDYGVRKTSWGEWKQIAAMVKPASEVKFKIKKTAWDVQVGTLKKSLHCAAVEDDTTLKVIDASEIVGEKKYFNDEALAVSKIGLSGKTTTATLTPLVWSGDFLVSSSVFSTKTATLVLPFAGKGKFNQGFLRIPLDAGGGVTGFSKDNELWLSAIDFVCRFKPHDGQNIDQDDMNRLMGLNSTDDLGIFPVFNKKTERNAYIKLINMLEPGYQSISNGNINILPGASPKTITIAGPTQQITVIKADLVGALRNMSDGVRARVVNENGSTTSVVLADSSKDKVVVLAGCR